MEESSSDLESMKMYTILLAEDSQTDASLVKQYFRKAGILNSFQDVDDGAKTIDYLAGNGIYSDRARYPFPILLLLDLNMPRKSGWEVLEWLHHHPPSEPLGIVVLTGEKNIQIMNRAYKLGAHSFLVKPLQFEDFVNLIKCVREIQLDSEIDLHHSPSFFNLELKPSAD